MSVLEMRGPDKPTSRLLLCVTIFLTPSLGELTGMYGVEGQGQG